MRASAVVREGRNRNRTDDRLSPTGRFLEDGWRLVLIASRTGRRSSARTLRPRRPAGTGRTDARRTDDRPRRSEPDGALPGAGETMAKKPRPSGSVRVWACRRSEHVEKPVSKIEKPLQTKAFSHELRLQQQHAVVPDRGRPVHAVRAPPRAAERAT